ncbi:hypothetical protein N752_19510 [Desulforamulus aquiferis]|nr:hypothetical protein N752_19510 [Desulforamulus aquiferis]
MGINATRALTCKHNAQLSCGRVQTPTLAIVARREEEINNFKPRTFYGITAITAAQLKLTWQDGKTKEHRIFEKDKCDKIVAALENKSARVIGVDKAKKTDFPPQLYDLTTCKGMQIRSLAILPRKLFPLCKSCMNSIRY